MLTFRRPLRVPSLVFQTQGKKGTHKGRPYECTTLKFIIAARFDYVDSITPFPGLITLPSASKTTNACWARLCKAG